MIRLEKPNIKYKESYIKAVKEILENGTDNESNEHYLKQTLDELEKNFEEFVKNKITRETKIEPNRVPGTEFWLINEKAPSVQILKIEPPIPQYF